MIGSLNKLIFELLQFHRANREKTKSFSSLKHDYNLCPT